MGGKPLDFLFRDDSIGDKGVLQQIFVNQDYRLDHWQQGKTLERFHDRCSQSGPSLIVDAGANIGASAVWFMNTFANSFVFSIEPDLTNYALLHLNTRSYGQKLNFHGAVSGVDGKVRLVDPGLSDWGFRTVASNGGNGGNGGNGDPSPATETEVDAISPASILSHPAVAGMQPLIFKIDIEGGEENLFSADISWMRRFPLIIIELHDWMLPFSGNSRNFIRAVAQGEFDMVYKGENIFLFNREILSS